MYYQHLPLYLKLTTLLKSLYTIVHHLSKEYKFSLGSEIISQNWELIDLFVEAQTNSEPAEKAQVNKARVIKQLSLAFDRFKIRIRFLGELKLVSLGQLASLNKRLEEIGKMIGSWQKHISK